MTVMNTNVSKGRFCGSKVRIVQMHETKKPIMMLWHHVQTSATRPVSFRHLTRRSIVQTLSPKCLATCICRWPYVTVAMARRLWTSVSRSAVEIDQKLIKISENDRSLWGLPNGMTSSATQSHELLCSIFARFVLSPADIVKQNHHAVFDTGLLTCIILHQLSRPYPCHNVLTGWHYQPRQYTSAWRKYSNDKIGIILVIGCLSIANNFKVGLRITKVLG